VADKIVTDKGTISLDIVDEIIKSNELRSSGEDYGYYYDRKTKRLEIGDVNAVTSNMYSDLNEQIQQGGVDTTEELKGLAGKATGIDVPPSGDIPIVTDLTGIRMPSKEKMASNVTSFLTKLGVPMDNSMFVGELLTDVNQSGMGILDATGIGELSELAEGFTKFQSGLASDDPKLALGGLAQTTLGAVGAYPFFKTLFDKASPKAKEALSGLATKAREYKSSQTPGTKLLSTDPTDPAVDAIIKLDELVNKKKNDVEMISINNFKTKDPLIVHHNINEQALKNIDRLGGLPSPSIAISKVEDPLTNFGDITLIGSPKMAKPSASNDVFRADGYTTRRPFAETFMNKKAQKFVETLGLSNSYQEIDDIAEIIYKADEGTYANQALRKAYLKSIGENPDTYNHSSFDNFRSGYQDYLDQLSKDMIVAGGSGNDKIFLTYTDTGRKYLPATLKNYVKIMKKKRGAGMESVHETMGSIRAKLSPQFRNISEIKAERDRVISKEQFEDIKNKVQLEYEKLMDVLRKKLPDDISFRTTEEMFADILLKKLGTHPYSSPFEKFVDDEVYSLADKVRKDLIDLPTEYFEIKPQRGVQLDEFEGAIVPAETKQDTIDLLRKNGISNILKYKNDEERKSLFKKFGNVVFTSTAGAGSAIGFSQMEGDDG